MKADFVIPAGNEEDFIMTAKRLGYECIVFLYPEGRSQNADEISKIGALHGIKAGVARYSDCRRNTGALFVKAESPEKAILECRGKVIFSIEKNSRKDFMHHRASGLNHVLCMAAKERGNIIGFSFNDIISAGKGGALLGRVCQNLRLCKKYDVTCLIASFAEQPYLMRSQRDIRTFFCCLGIDKKKINEYIIESSKLAEGALNTAKDINTRLK